MGGGGGSLGSNPLFALPIYAGIRLELFVGNELLSFELCSAVTLPLPSE